MSSDYQRDLPDRVHAAAEAEQERLDRVLGSAMSTWAAAVDGVAVELQGPLDAPGMDPRWILSLRSKELEAEVCLFYGPILDIAAFRPSDPASGVFVDGEDGLTETRLVEVLDGLAAAARGGPMPSWLRSIEQ